MTKKNKLTLIILAAVLIVSLVFAGLSFGGVLSAKLSTDNGTDFASIVSGEFKSEYPLVQTELEDVFYEAYPDGSIKYYKYSDNSFNEVSGVRTKEISVVCSYQKIPMTLYYMDDTDVGTIGYGLFTIEQDTSIQTFSYIFARLIDCLTSYESTARTSHVLLLDMDAEDAYKVDKTYSDIYSFDMNSGTSTLIVSSRDRIVQENATQDESWTIFTDSSVNGMCHYDWFATTRYHDTDAEKLLYDFMSVESSRSVRKASATVFVNSPSYHLWEKDGSVYCFSDGDDGFSLVKDGKKDNVLKEFDGSFSDYVVSGHHIFNPSQSEFTDIYTGETVSVKKASINTLSGFVASPGGQQFAVFCDGDTQAMIIYDLENDRAEIAAAKDIFDDGTENYCFINNKTLVVSSYEEDGTALNRIVTL